MPAAKPIEAHLVVPLRRLDQALATTRRWLKRLDDELERVNEKAWFAAAKRASTACVAAESAGQLLAELLRTGNLDAKAEVELLMSLSRMVDAATEAAAVVEMAAFASLPAASA